MPNYEYQSDDGEIIEKYFSIKADHPEKIFENQKEYRRIISCPSILIVDLKKPKTLGALAEKNRKITPEKPKPFWRKDKKKIDMSLNKLTPKQKEKYIKTGKKS